MTKDEDLVDGKTPHTVVTSLQFRIVNDVPQIRVGFDKAALVKRLENLKADGYYVVIPIPDIDSLVDSLLRMQADIEEGSVDAPDANGDTVQ